MRAGFDNNPALQNLQRLILGLTDLDLTFLDTILFSRLLRTNSSKTAFDECRANFNQRLEAHWYPQQNIERSLSEVNFDQRQSALKQK